MRKTFLAIFVVSLLLMPTLAYAQNDVVIDEMNIQFWPEYDRAEMLVMYSIILTEETALPANVTIRVPADADINAVAKLSEGSMLNVPYDTPIRDGDWVEITLVIDEMVPYRVEYYTAMEKEGATRNYSLEWENGYDINLLLVEFQQPPSATNLVSEPAFTDQTPVQEGMIYHTFVRQNFAASEVFSLNLSYDKANDDITISSMPVEVGGAPENEPVPFSLSDSLPAILVGVGVLLIVGGLLYFFLAGRSETASPTKRKRSKGSGEAKYCHECGSRASGNDKFCRSCGVKLRG
ncbi:MAG: zinc ribbon domain-containing protein [Anaerolineae bacterium]|jgi:hypothetical protein|nr:zinc ribbon domain-containing protein [Anaerolineae bacterium]MBT7191277.1 zinc ribbon domain-containing protein [Anaerolineae bacterium]MBT7991414.1 zinc ribbon domain-containing protein [Anaerolineae bacterium]